MFRLFVAGGALGMSILTIELIGLFFTAWKAPAWVKEVGLMALLTGFFMQFIGLYRAAEAICLSGELSVELVAGGFRASLISVLYGMIIYFISLIIRMLQKPKLM